MPSSDVDDSANLMIAIHELGSMSSMIEIDSMGLMVEEENHCTERLSGVVTEAIPIAVATAEAELNDSESVVQRKLD